MVSFIVWALFVAVETLSERLRRMETHETAAHFSHELFFDVQNRRFFWTSSRERQRTFTSRRIGDQSMRTSKLNNHQQEIFQWINFGVKKRAIAEKLGVTPVTLSRWLRKQREQRKTGS